MLRTIQWKPFTKQHEKQSESTNRVAELEVAPRITKLYDRTRDEITQNSPLCPTSPKIDVLKFDYSAFDDAPLHKPLGFLIPSDL